MAEQDYSTLSEDELQKVVDSNGAYDPFAGNDAETANQNGGAEPDYSNMSEADLQRIIDSNGEWMPEQKREDYGFMERQNDQITAEGGRDAYPGQALIEGATPLTRAMRQGKERDEDKELGAWLSDGEDNTLRVALKKHGLERDPSLEGYKAKETGGFWEGFGDDMSRTLAQLPFGAGWLFRKAREADNPQKYATDHLMQSAFLSGFSRADIEQAKEFSQGDPAKMYDFFAERAEGRLKGFAAKKQGAQEKLAAHQDDQGFLEKVGSGTLGMAPMLMEFALGGAAGKVLTGATKLNAIARAAGTGTWKGRLVNGIVHGVGTTGVLGPEMVRRGVGELTADEYGVDENGNLLKRKGDDTATALKKAIPGRLSEVAIFSMPFGEAALGWATPAITKALRTKVGQTAAKFYENYVKYGQMTGLRGQPQMLALMDLNAFKDEVLGWGVKDADYEGREAAWQKFKDETLSIKGQTDLLVGALGVMLAQGSVAGANAWRQGRAQKLSNDRRLHAAFNIPQEQLEKMEPELKRMLVRVGDNLYNGRDAFGRSKVRAEQDRMHGKDVGTFEERLKRWCDKVGERLGKASGEVFDEAGKYALEFDNSFGWEKDAGTGQFASRFQVPEAREMRVGRDGVGQEHSMIPWEDVDVPLGNGVSVEGKQFTDPNTGISVLRYLRTDAKAGDNGYIYLIRDENGHRATRYGSADAMDAARAMDVVNQRNESMRNVKAQMADKIRASMPALEGTDMFYAKDGAEFDAVLQQFSEKPIEPTGEGVRGVTLPNGRVMLCLDRIENPQQMKDTMLHEAGRHAGLDLALPDVADKMGFVAGLAKSGDPVVQNQLNRIVEARMAKHEIERPEDIFKRDKNGNYLHANALEEVYAHLFDRSDVPEEAGWWDAHMNAMRRNIRKVFKGLSYSRSEAEEMYRGAMEKLKEQTGYSFYEPEVSPRERMVAEQRQREENQRIGHEAERDVAEIMDEEGLQERRRAEGEALGERVQGEADAQRNEQGAENVRAALDEAGNEIGAERERREKAREITRKRKEEIAEQKAEGEAYDEQERQRIERERKEEQDAQDEAELQRMYDEEARAKAEAQTEEEKGEEQPPPRRESLADEADRLAQNPPRIPEDDRIDRIAKAKERAKQKEIADRNARLKKAGEEYDRAEEERKRREEEEQNALPKITVTEEAEPQGKERTAPQNDALRVNYGPNGNQIIARRVTDESGKVIGWDVNAVGNDGTETYIASTTKPKKDGLAAIRAVRRQIHDHFGLPYGKEARDAMDAERRRLEEAERTGDRKDEARTMRDEEQPQPEPREERLSAEGEDEGFAETGNPQGEERDAVVVHHANEGREGDGVKAAEDALQGLFGDEGITSRPEGAESVEARSRASDDDLAFLRSLPPDFKFFDQSESLMDDKRRDGNQKLVNLIGNLYDRKKIRGFGGFAKLVKAENPAIWTEQKDRLRGLWNYAAELSDGEIPRVGDNEARDAIRSADEGRNVRDVSGINALQAALQNIDVEMYPAAKLDSSDSRVPNMKREADPKTGIIPGNELKGRPRSLLSKPILGVEFEDGTVAVGTGRHRKNLYERFGMDIPMRRVREADGWVTKKPDGTYDFTKIRLLDALDNIQDGKGSVEDYVAFFRDVQIPRGEAESEGFLGSKEARYAYAIANDAHPDVRAAINYEGGKVDGMIKPEQAAAIAEIAPVGGERAKENADLQHYLLKAVQKDSSLDRRDLDIKASEAMHMARVKQAQDGAQQMGFDFFGDEDVQNAAAKAEKYRAQQAAKFSRLAKNLRQAQRSNENDLAQIKIAREDMRELGINERKVAAGGKEKRDELQKAIDNALLQQMRWESVSLDPDLRAQMEKDLGIAPTTAEKSAESGRDFALESVTQGQINAETEAQRQRDEIKRRLEAPLKAGAAEDGQTLMDLGGQEGGDLFNKVRFYDENESAKDFEKRQYAPAKYRVPGAVKSRTLLEEPPALRATEPPDNDYKIQIPPKHIKNGDLQEHQLEFVGYAGRAHGMKDANGSPLGMMGGYGTGAGKSRMIAGTILDNRWRGRNRALWITTQRGLIDDVRSECEPFGMGNLVEDIGDKPVPKNGIGFTTYSNLRNEGVVQKIAKELGRDFDGVIAFDEIHRAKTEGGRTQDAVVKLQELLPKAKVIYMSATGATDVGNLGYATRLGLWGEGTPFKDFEDFKNKVEGKGVSAMEMVARTLKRRGQYLSANLSKEGVEFDHVAVPTTDAQKRTYTEYNNALKDVYRGVYDALEVLGRLDYKVPPSSLHGMQQRLHYSMVTALKIPTLIERAKQELAKGNVPVFSLVNTNEAGATREVAKALEEGRQVSMDEVNFGPKQILLDFLTKEGDKTYKTKSDTHLGYKDYQFPTMKPVKDPGGEVIGFERDQIADGIRRRLVSEVEKLPDDFGNPINMIIDAFGKDNVANLTGLNREGMAKDYKAFQDGDKKVLVFSGVANTGYTFSSDRKYKNQARRVAFPLQLGYRADELEQTLGRVHRNNQANAPIYVASTTDLPGERRFYSSVERRRGQMKALTTGDRAATGNGITSEGDNFETKYAQQAVDAIIATLHRMGKLDDIAREMNFIKRIQKKDGTIAEVNGMLKRDKSGAILPNVSAKRFLNRLLMLDPKKQDNMFSAFKNYLDQIVRWAKEDGEYDIGLQDIGSTHNDPVRSVKLADDMDVAHINSWFKTDKVSFDDFAKAHAAEFLTYVRNKRTGETFAVRADGKMGKKQEPAAMRYAVDGTKRRMKASILDTEKPNAAYERLDAAKAKELWDAEYGVIPDERADDGFYATGDLLKHWNDVLGSKPPRTFRVKAGDAPEYIGAKIDTDEIPAIFGRFGKAEEARDMVIDGKVREVLNNRTVDLVNGWTLKQVPRDGAKAVMVRGVEPTEIDAVAKELGGEVSKKRIFMEPDAAKLRKIIEEHPANLYRDDEKIGDTGNLRFFNREEEALPDRDRDRQYRDWLAKYRLADSEKHRMEWERKHLAQEKQTALSGDTSLNQNPSGNRYAQAHGLFKPGTRNIDIGAGKFDKATQFLREQGVENIPYDPVNRDAETNRRAAESVRENPADTATVHNVLNVIDNDAVMEGIVNQAARAIKKDGTAIFTIYEGDRSGNGRVTTKGYQRNAKASAYVPVLEKYFGEVKTHGNVITARQPKDVGSAFWAEDSSFDRGLRFFNIDEEAGRRVHAKDLDEARRMEGAGAGRREIWEKTGWWKAKDGKWRYEIAGISDADTKRMLDFALASGKFYDRDRANVYSFTLNDLEAAMRERGERLPDSVKTLLAAYPKLGKETIEVDRMAAQPTDGTLGYATKGKIHLYERGTTADTLNHELQHRIQAASGMAGGTNTDGKSFGRYTQEHGEWEARQAATRAGMDADERGRTAPWETSDRHGVAEDMTQIDDANRARIRPDGEPEEPEPAAPAADRDTTLGEKYRTNVTDRYDAIKQMEIATGKRDKKDLHVENSPYNAMRLLHGHNEAARQRYEKIWKRPFEDMLRKSGVTADDVGMYMIAENAKDRNRKVMDRSGVLDGAGLSDADADRLKSDLRSRLGDAKMQKIQEMANFLWKMQKEGMARRVESGRVSKEMADQWETEEPHHVPMRDDLSDENGEYNRSTRQWTQNDYRKAEGRYTLPDNPVEFMFKEYQDAMYGSNINEARRKLADFVRTTPGIGKIRKGVRIGKGWSFTHGQMENFADPNYREQTVKGGAGKPNLVSFKEGGDLYMIELNGKQGERVAEAVIGRGVHNIGASKDSGAAAKLYAKGMRAYASTATEWSIPFLGRNVIADMIEASINTMADKGVIKGGAAAVKNAINAIRMSGTIYKYIKDGKFEGKFADVMRRYVESGSLIGGMGNEGVTEIKTDLGKVEAGKHGVLDVVKFMGRGISGINKMGELATRLAVFKNYIDGGASDGEASMRSREYSTDFNKYGNQRWMNSVWMFSGSVIGGATRQMASLALGKHGVQTITALFSYGVAEALLEHFYNADDDEKAKRTGASSGQTMNEHYRANSLYFRIGDRFIRIPFHAGPFSMIKYAGNLVARLALGDIDGAEFAKRLGKESVDNGMHFTGTGDFNSDTIAQSIAPTLAVPFVQAKGNENYLGNPIAKRMYSETKPYSENGRKYTSDVWKGIARGMNALGGGNEKRRGLELFDNRPEMYKNAWDSLGKNVTRDISTVVDFVTDLIEGKTIDNRHKPVLGDYWKDVPDNTDNFYDAERLYKSRRADGTIKQGSRRDEAVKKLLREIDTLRHWEAGEEKKSGKWVPMRKAPSESAKEKNKKMRLKYQQQVINLMNR